MLAAAARASGAWGILLTWPAISLAIVGFAYFGLGPGIYRKEDGRLPLSTRLVLAPCLIGQWLSLRYYCRQCRPWDAAAPGIWIGRVLADRKAVEAIRRGVTAVLDVTAEFSAPWSFLTINYLNLPILDLTAPPPDRLRRAVDFLHENAARGTVYVHCKIGYSRSATIVGAYLLSTGIAKDPDEAVAMIHTARPTIVVRPEAMRALTIFHASLEQSAIAPGA